MASNADVLGFSQITRPSQAGDPGGGRHLFLEHGRSYGGRDPAGMATWSSFSLPVAQVTFPYFSLDKAGHLAAPEFNMARYVFLSQEGITTCQSLTLVSSRCDPPLRRGGDFEQGYGPVSPLPQSKSLPLCFTIPPTAWCGPGLERPLVAGLMRKGEVLIPLECGDKGDRI